MASVKGDNDLPPCVLAADVFQRSAGFFECIAPIDHGAQLSFMREPREILEIGRIHTRDESDQLFVHERVDDLSLEHAEDGPDPRFLLGAANPYQRAAR